MPLREEFLRLLKEDEEFRLAVAAYIGIAATAEKVDKLVEAIERLRRAVEAQARLVKGLRSRAEAFNETAKKQGKEVEKLSKAMEDLRELSALHERRLGELTEAVNGLREVSARHEALLAKLIELSALHEKRLTRIERDVRGMRRSLERLTISLEEEANSVVSHLLKERGIDVTTSSVTFDSKYEFDVYGTNGEISVVGEAKVRAGSKTVKRLVERVSRAASRWPEKLPGKLIKVLYCMRATPDAVREAEKSGVWLIESMRERTKPAI